MILDIIPNPWNGKILRDSTLLISTLYTSLKLFSKLVETKKNPEISRCCKRHAPSPRACNN